MTPASLWGDCAQGLPSESRTYNDAALDLHPPPIQPLELAQQTIDQVFAVSKVAWRPIPRAVRPPPRPRLHHSSGEDGGGFGGAYTREPPPPPPHDYVVPGLPQPALMSGAFPFYCPFLLRSVLLLFSFLAMPCKKVTGLVFPVPHLSAMRYSMFAVK
jgi:hypothetical protein